MIQLCVNAIDTYYTSRKEDLHTVNCRVTVLPVSHPRYYAMPLMQFDTSALPNPCPTDSAYCRPLMVQSSLRCREYCAKND